MGILTVISIVLVIAAVGYVLARSRAVALVGGETERLHSRPGYYGAYALIWSSIPALLLLALWNVAAPVYIEGAVRATFPEAVRSAPASEANLAMNMVRSVGEGIRLLDERERTQLVYTKDMLLAPHPKEVPLRTEGQRV